MAASFGGFDLNSLDDLSESDNNGLNVVADGLGNKNLIENSNDGFRILDKGKVSVVGKDMIGESMEKGKEFGEMGENNDGSKSNVEEVMECDDDFMLDMVGRVLDGKFGCVDEERGDGNGSQSGSGVNLVVDLNLFGDATSEKGNLVNGSEKANEMVTGGDSESKEGIKKEADVLMTENYGEQFISEKYDDEYYVSDLVWGKVRGHPWWPGQIFSPSAASNKALEYIEDDSYLIAYFGDGTFAWNEESKIQPFYKNFSEMEKQCNTEEVCHALSCALDEVSRRIEDGLSCACLPEEVRSKIETQVVVNAGIREKNSKRVGGGRFFTAETTFFPDEIVDFVKSVATHPKREIGTLSVAEKKAELAAFSRWSGRYYIPVFIEFGDLVDDEKGERNDYEEVDNCQSNNRKSRARPSFDGNPTYKKKRRISSLMSSKKCSEIPQRSGARKWQKGENVLNKSLNVCEIVSKLMLAAKNPMQFGGIMGQAADFILECRSLVYWKKSLLLKTHGCNEMKQSSSSTDAADEFVIQSSSQSEECENEITGDNKPTALILQFDKLESIPPVTNLNEIFRHYGHLMESETKISSKNMRAQVIFEKQAAANAAYSSPGKYRTFGPSLVKYALNHTPTLRKARGISKQNKKSPT